MTVTLMALISIQVYWIKNTLMVRQAIFTRNVNEAVTKAVFKLESIDRAKSLDRGGVSRAPFDFNAFRDSITIFFEKDLTTPYHLQINGFESPLLDRDHLVKALFNIQPRPSLIIEQRVSKPMIDSVLRRELDKVGINTSYEFGVFSPTRRELTLQKTGLYANELLNSNYRYLLFPGEIFSAENYLMLYFPYAKEYVMTQVWGLMALSVALISIIIFSFAYVVSTVFRQKKLSEMKNDFINNMTHEFKTPIATISLACQALSDKDIIKNTSVYDSYVSVINQENQRLSGMAERILQSARLQKGEILLNSELLNLHDMIQDSAAKVNLGIETKGGVIHFDLKAKEAEIEGDRVHITNIIFNLLDNAIKYTPWAPIITIATKNVGDGIVMSIKDNGIGISKSNQKKIFEKLYRVPTGNVHNVKGYGLGLAYVKSVVKKHQGKITVDSELKKGSSFNVFLPLKQNI